ncbi:MAG TPA: TonB-dependent receptor [Burkholderiales bacterium]|nr:TonB-dependent receptor [Burkholderiales bacterium]
MKSLAALIVAAMAATGARADEPERADGTKVDPVVVTATRTPEPLSSIIQPIELINEQQIQQAGQNTVSELLQSQANVEITSNGGFGQTSGVFLRGSNTTHTLVLIDGIRLNNAGLGTVSFENLPTPQFSRIEVVPGPFSGLYGSDALGGVIQFFTHRWPDAPLLTGVAGYGTYDTSNVYGGVSAGTDNTGFTVNAGYMQSRGFSATNPSAAFGTFNPDNDGYRNSNVSGSIVHRFAPDQEIGITTFYTQGHTQFDSGPTTDDMNDEAIGVYSIYSRNRLTDWWQSLLRVGGVQDDSVIQGAFPGQFDSDQTQVTWQNDFATSIGTVIAGFDYLRQTVGGTTAFAVDGREIYGLFAGYSAQIGRNTLYASLRNDENSQFGDHPTGSLGYAFAVTPEFRLRASGGNAFHAPTFDDLYFPGFGNPNLQPEKGTSWEVGADFKTGTQRVSATYFNSYISQLIVVDSATFQPMNLNAARIQGLELAYDGVVHGVELRARLTLQDPVDAADGDQLPRRAKIFGNAGVARSFGAFKLGAEVVGASARFDSIDQSPDSRMGGYALFNLVASYKIDRDWRVDLRWNNVFNKNYELAQGYNTPGSNVFVWVKYELQK